MISPFPKPRPVDGRWQDAMRQSMQKKKPPEGWPKPIEKTR